MDTIEEVARAICIVWGDRPDSPRDAHGNEKMWQLYIESANAAIKAMAGDSVLVRIGWLGSDDDIPPVLLVEDALKDWPDYEVLWPTEGEK